MTLPGASFISAQAPRNQAPLRRDATGDPTPEVPPSAVQEPRAEPTGGGPRTVPPDPARGWVRDWDGIPDPLGGETLPVVVEVLRWVS